MGQRDAHRAHVDTPCHLFRKPLSQCQSTRHPRRLAAQDMGNSLEAETVFVMYRMHHLGFVHGRERAGRTVGFEQRHLLL